VLKDFGVDVSEGSTPRQIQCPFHAGGAEDHLSARVYPATNSFYCWAEHKSYTPVSAIMEGFGIDWYEAKQILFERYGDVGDFKFRNPQRFLEKVADILKVFTREDFVSPELDSILVGIARGDSESLIMEKLRVVVESRWPYFSDNLFR